jgi:hypothetical protein
VSERVCDGGFSGPQELLGLSLYEAVVRRQRWCARLGQLGSASTEELDELQVRAMLVRDADLVGRETIIRTGPRVVNYFERSVELWLFESLGLESGDPCERGEGILVGGWPMRSMWAGLGWWLVIGWCGGGEDLL